jgi:glycosyltransferase involved in cell wall biosynthesis
MESDVKIAFVTPWYGPEIPGGMEAETRRTAVHLHKAGFQVEVLTTCIREFLSDWAVNFHRPGVEEIDGIMVRRFPVGKRNRQAFDAVNLRLMNNLPITPEQERTFLEEMFRVPELYHYIAGHAQQYIFFFIPYLFPTTYLGGQICPERSVVVPCLHDESYARLSVHRQVLPAVRAMILFSEAELRLADRLYGPPQGQLRRCLGGGVDTDFRADAGRFRRTYGVEGPFVLYAGRRDAGKNVPLLLDYWHRYILAGRRDLKLVLIGSGSVAVPPEIEDSVVDLGFVPAQSKGDAYAAATLLCQPSVNESFSVVIMESWVAGRPVLVHGRCAVTREHCQKANGGLYFTDYEEFASTLNYLLDRPDVAAAMGQNGRRYVLDNFQWSIIVAKYGQIINQLIAEINHGNQRTV